ncbi:MAG: hypothetical protein U0401_28510 [Anaerolineae bacterium]
MGSPSNSFPNRLSINYGIGMIHQHFMLVDNLTVAGTKIIAGTTTAGSRISRRIRELAAKYGLQVDPTFLPWRLGSSNGSKF